MIGGTVVSSAIKFVYETLSRDITANNTVESKNNVESLLQIVKTPFKKEEPTTSIGESRRKLRFLNSTDPKSLRDATADLSRQSTIVLSLDIEQQQEKCQAITLLVRNWLIGTSTDNAVDIVKKQMYLITTNETKRNNNTFVIPSYSEAFLTLSIAGLLPLSLLLGWEIVSDFLNGAHSLDCHFVETNPRHNLGVVTALIDVWNDVFMDRSAKINVAGKSFSSLTKFVSTFEQRVLNGRHVGDGSLRRENSRGPSPVVDGNGMPGTLGWNSYEFVTSFDTNDDEICSLFQYADALAFGNREVLNSSNAGLSSPGSPPAIQSCDSMLSASSGVNVSTGHSHEAGNQPSTIVICGKNDAFAIGQLVALAEHRALVKAWLWGVDPLDTSATSSASKGDTLKEGLKQIYQELTIRDQFGEDEDEHKTDGGGVVMHGSTRTLLSHFATRVQDKRASN